MSKLSEFIDAAGSRADAVPTFAKECFAHLEARIEALESFAQVVPRVGDAASAQATTGKLKTAAKAAAAALEAAIEEDV